MHEQIKNFIHSRENKILESERLYCRPLNSQDLDLIREIYLEVYANSMVAPDTPATEDGCKTKLDRFIKFYEDSGLSCYAVCKKTTCEPVGIAGLTYMDETKTSVEINYGFPERGRGKGYGIEMANTLAEFSFKDLGLKELYGETLSYNTRSQSILQKLGMKPTDKTTKCPNYKDEYFTVFSITKEEYESTNKTEAKKHPEARKFRDLILKDYRKSSPHPYAKLTYTQDDLDKGITFKIYKAFTKNHADKRKSETELETEIKSNKRATNYANIMRSNRDIGINLL